MVRARPSPLKSTRALSVFLATLSSLPFAALMLRCSGLLRGVADAFDVALGVVCHRLPERSFHLCGREAAVCGRCFGLYAGVFVAALTPIGGLRLERLRLVSLGAGLVLGAELLAESRLSFNPGNTVRAFVGLAFGFAFAVHLRRSVELAICQSGTRTPQ